MMVPPSIGMNVQQRIQRTPSPDRGQCEEKGQNKKPGIPISKTCLRNRQVAHRNTGQQPDHDFHITYIPFHD